MFDLFQPEDLAGKLGPDEAGWKRVEWNAAAMSPWSASTNNTDNASSARAPSPELAYRPVQGVTGLKLEQGKLAGEITGPASVLDFVLRDNRGGADSVHAIEVRMTVSGAKQVWLRPDGTSALEDQKLRSWASQTEPWKTATNVVEGKLYTYRFEIQNGPGGPGGPPPTPPAAAVGPGPAATNHPPPGVQPAPLTNMVATGAPPPGAPSNPGRSGDLRHFTLSFRDATSGKFAIESVRIISEKEEKLKDPSGQQWAGLAEIYHASLAAKTPESIRIPLRALPERGRLDFAYGTKEDAPVKFTVAVSDRDGSKAAAPAVLFQRTVTVPNRWQTAHVDLGAYAGKNVLIEFTLAGDKKGLWGYWGSPMIRSHENTSLAAAAGSGAQKKPKPRGVILLVIDTLRKDHLNLYGYSRETIVHLKKFAEEGVAFDHAISQGTMTKISVPSIVTSLYPMSHTVLDFEHGLPASAKTIAEVFRDAGYSTVAYSSVGFTGKANNMHQGYDELHESGSISDNEYRSKTARHYVDRLIPWLQEHQDEPFFVFLHVFDPHSPFRPRPPYDTLWGAPGAKDRLAELEADMHKHDVHARMDNLPNKADYLKTGNDPGELLQIYKDWYDGSIRGADAEIGRLLEALKELGLENDTLMVWATDHGEEFWEHGRLFHGHSVYGELNQVPMVFHWPNSPDVRKGVMVEQQVQDLDIMPTILELAGIPGPSAMQGRSLVPLLNGTGVGTWQEQPAITQAMVDSDSAVGPPGGKAKPHFGIIDHGWKLIRKEVEPAVQQELYEHPTDSLNLTNLFAIDGAATRIKSLGDTLEAWKTKARAAQLPSDDTMAQNLSSEELRRLRALGYVGGGTTTAPATNAAPRTNSPPKLDAVAGTNSAPTSK